MTHKVLVVGWFSFPKCKATAGDLMACDLVCKWVDQAGYAFQVALARPFLGGVNCWDVDPKHYSHLVFVCGPFGRGKEILALLDKFSHCRLIGIDVSMLDSPEQWNPFDILIERDSTRTHQPDITFLSTQKKTPVVGVILAHVQEEYTSRSNHLVANQAIKELLLSNNATTVYIDTCLDPNTTKLRNASEVESLISKMDLVITTRLHGTVLALKNNIPVIAIDAVIGGAKVSNQARAINWPIIFPIDDLDHLKLQSAFDYCLTEEAKQLAMQCSEESKKKVDKIAQEFVKSLDLSNIQSTRVDLLSSEDNSQPIFKSLKMKLNRKFYQLKDSVRIRIHSVAYWLLEINF